MSEQPPKTGNQSNLNDQPPETPIDAQALLDKYNLEASKQQPADVGAQLKALNQEIADNPAPEEVVPDTPVNQIGQEYPGEAHNTPESTQKETVETDEAVKEWLQGIGNQIVQGGILPRLGESVNTKRAEQGEGFKVWTAYRDALVDHGLVASPEEMSHLEAKSVIDYARGVEKLVTTRKAEIVTKLAEDSVALRQIGNVVHRARQQHLRNNNGKLDGFSEVRADRISHIMKDPSKGLMQESTASVDAFLSPADMQSLYFRAKKINQQKQAEANAAQSSTAPKAEGTTNAKTVSAEQPALGIENAPTLEVQEPISQATAEQSEDNKQELLSLKGQITHAAEVFVTNNELYTEKYRQALGKARFEFNREVLDTLDDSALSAQQVNNILNERWRKEGQAVATVGALQEIGLLPDANLEGLQPKDLRRLSAEFWTARKESLKQTQSLQDNESAHAVGDEAQKASNAEGDSKPEKLTLAQLEARWKDLRSQYSRSNGNQDIKHQVDAAYASLEEARRSPQTVVDLEEDLRLMRLDYSTRSDSPEKRALKDEIHQKFQELQSLKQWQAENVDTNQPVGREPLPPSPDDPVDEDEALAGPTNEEIKAYAESLSEEYAALDDKSSEEAIELQAKIRTLMESRYEQAPTAKPFPTYGEALAKFKETDTWKNASDEERKALEDTFSDNYLAEASTRLESLMTTDTEAPAKDERTKEQKQIDALLRTKFPNFEQKTPEQQQAIRDTLEALFAADLIDKSKLPAVEETNGTQPEKGALTPLELNIQEQLGVARDRYAELTAKSRKGFLARFLQGDGRLTNKLRSIPKVAGWIDSINERLRGKHGQAIGEARERLIVAEIAAQTAAKTRLEKIDKKTPEQVKEAMIALQIDADRDLEDKIIAERQKQSKKAGKFTNWWVSQKTTKQRILKGALVIGSGLLVGAAAGGIAIAAGVAGPALGIFGIGAGVAGKIAGGATGFGIAKGVTSRRANATTLGANGETVATYQSGIDRTIKAKAISLADGDIDTAVRRMISYTEQSTANEMLANRKRIRTATGLGMLAGGIGGGVTGGVVQEFFTHKANVDAVGNRPPRGAKAGAKIEHALDPKLDNSFNVEHGSGLIREWDQWASANGHPINGHTATQLHHAVLKHFGPDGIIDLRGVGRAAETYTQSGDVRIGAPGGAHWRTGVGEFAQKWLEANGKW